MKKRSGNNKIASSSSSTIASRSSAEQKERREKIRIHTTRGDAGLGRIDRRDGSEKDNAFQTGSYTSKSSRQTFGGTMILVDYNKKKNADGPNNKMLHPAATKPSGPVRTKSGFWGFGRIPGRTDAAVNDENKSMMNPRPSHPPESSSTKPFGSQLSRQPQRSKQLSSRGNNNIYHKNTNNNINNSSRRKQMKNKIQQEEDFDLEPSQRFYDHEEDQFLFETPGSIQKGSHQRSRTRSEKESYFSEEHSDSTLSTKEQFSRDLMNVRRLSPRTPPPPIPSTPNRRVNHFMALAHHGDWADLPETPNDNLIKSPDRKPRHLEVLRRLVAPAESSSSTSDSDDAGTYISGATPIDNRELLEFTDEDEDDEFLAGDDDDNNDDPNESIVIRKTDDHFIIQRKVSRMTSDQLRRWDGFQDQVVTLVQAAMPDAVDDVPKLMRQFSGREAELIQTLQNILQRSSHRQRDRKSVLPKSKAIVGTRRVSNLHMDAIATIAAANVLDDTMLAVKPEYVVDKIDACVEQSSSEKEDDDDNNSDNRSSYSDDDDDDSESSQESSFDEDDDDLSGYDKDDSTTSSEDNLNHREHSVSDECSDDGDGGATTLGDGSFWDGYDA